MQPIILQDHLLLGPIGAAVWLLGALRVAGVLGSARLRGTCTAPIGLWAAAGEYAPQPHPAEEIGIRLPVARPWWQKAEMGSRGSHANDQMVANDHGCD